MRGGEVLFIGGRARGARHDCARRVMVARLACTPPKTAVCTSSILARVSFFDPIFEGSFGGLPELKMGHAAYFRKALDVLFPTIPIKRGMLSANREFHVVAGVVIFPTHPGSWINLLRAGKTLRAKAAVREEKRVFTPSAFFSQILSQFARIFDLAPDVGFRRSWYRWKACAAYFCKVPDLRKSELGLVRYGPANRGHRSVFGPFEGSFPIGIPASPGRLCAQAWQRRWKNSGTFSKTLFRRPVFTRMVDVAPDVGFRRSWYRRKAYATYFPKVQALHRGELGFARYDPANGGRRNVPYAKGSSSD
uniref:Uncharacterized protein n=1 Tax=Fagus sylvatica TaxID=28930 RepID=A0A2N9FX55_FAGSY